MGDKITVLFPITDLELHGAQHQLLELVKGLDKERFSPVVLTLTAGGPMEQAYKAVPESSLINLERRGKLDLVYLFKIINLLRKMKVDVIQPFLTPATFYSLLPAFLCRTPVKIATERNSLKIKEHGGFGYQCYLKIEDILTRFADWAVSNSLAGGDCLIQRGVNPRRIKVINNGINLSSLTCDERALDDVRKKLNLPAGGKVVGMIARMFPIKRHDIFLRAAAIINHEIPSTKFALLGDGPLRNTIEHQSEELNLTSRVIFFGEQQDIVPYVSSFDIVALSSDSEGLSLSLCEAMALGKPIVATDAGGNRELVEDGKTGFIVPLGDFEGLAKAIIHLLRDPDMAQAMGQRAREKITTQFSTHNMVCQYQSLYEETLRRKTSQVKKKA
jgi:glycosyltransferase involved in cell wall biosynthesis